MTVISEAAASKYAALQAHPALDFKWVLLLLPALTCWDILGSIYAVSHIHSKACNAIAHNGVSAIAHAVQSR
jgi:hypothetical protein